MNYIESKKYLDEICVHGSTYGLATIQELLKRLNNPQNELKFIHVAGTNGKGSTLAYLSTVLSKAGYCTGRYISPHMVTYRERIQVNGEYIEKESMAKHLTVIKEACDQMKAEGLAHPTYFEIGTALAFMYFKERNCDLVVLETGLGGALDATNAVSTTLVEIIASISKDHTELLGDTLAKITKEKAGIIKPNTKVVSAKQKEEAEYVLKTICKERNCDLRIVDNTQISEIVYGCGKQSFSYKNWKQIVITLAGTYQMKNASLVLEAIQALRDLGYEIPDESVYEGMKETTWWGRFTRIAQKPTVIIDGAHNEDAARELRDSLQMYFKDKKIYYVLGVLKDKDYEKVIALTAPFAHHIVTVQTPDNPRALSAQDLKEAVSKVNPSVEAASSIKEAVHIVKQSANTEDVIVIFGSLSFLGEAQDAVLEGEENE